MKKIFLYSIIILLGTWIFPVAWSAPMIAPVRSMVIPYAPEGVIIDAVADDCYSVSQTTTAFNVSGATGNDADYTLTFKVCYDSLRLYLFAHILDDYASEIPYTTSPSPYMYDNVEVYISLDTVGTTAVYDSNTIQLRFNRGIIDSAQAPGRADQSEYAGYVYYENTAEGWNLEVGIPWTAVLGPGQLPEDIRAYMEASSIHGFDVMGYDNDTDGPDVHGCRTAWDEDDPASPDETEDLAWCNRTVFGIMALGTSDISQRPVANAGPDQTVDENSLVTLDGTGSYDPQGESITYTWTASSPITLSDRYAANLSFTAPEVNTNSSYTIKLTVNDGTQISTADEVVINVIDVPSNTSPEFEESSLIKLFPNPANRLINIDSEELICSVEIIDIAGKVVKQNKIDALHAKIDLGDCSAGTYIIKVKTATGEFNRQFVVE